ncbi:hypothetical protein K2X40_02365 [Candidatus Babeliales bacterium]|nr:hypothetical protein [Candidatus Babeliales bacterium]
MKTFKKLFLNLCVASCLFMQTLSATTVQLVTLWSPDGRQRVHVFFDVHGYDSEYDMFEKFEYLKKNLSAGSSKIDLLVEGGCFPDAPESRGLLLSKIRFLLSPDYCAEFSHLKMKDVHPSSYRLHGRLLLIFRKLYKVLPHVQGRSIEEIAQREKKYINNLASLVEISLDQVQEAFEQDRIAIKLVLNDSSLPAFLQDTFSKIVSDSETQLALWKKTIVDCFEQDALKVPLLKLFVSKYFVSKYDDHYADKFYQEKILDTFLSILSLPSTGGPHDKLFGMGNLLECSSFFHIISEPCADTIAAFMGADHAYFLVSFLEQAGYVKDSDFTIDPNEKILMGSEEEFSKAFKSRTLISLPKEIYNVLSTDPAELAKIGIEVSDISAGAASSSSSGSSSSSSSSGASSSGLSLSSSSSSAKRAAPESRDLDDGVKHQRPS